MPKIICQFGALRWLDARQFRCRDNVNRFVSLPTQEDEILFTRTMHGVMKNVSHLCTRDRSRTWGANGWTKVVICIVSDGRSKVNPRTLSVLAAMGVYQDGVAKNVVNGKPVAAHIYEVRRRAFFFFFSLRGSSITELYFGWIGEFLLEQKLIFTVHFHLRLSLHFIFASPVYYPTICRP